MRISRFSAISVPVMVVIGGLYLLMLNATQLRPATPPLLEGGTMVGSFWSQCPPEDPGEAKWPQARSPEIEQRLRKQFPRGTDSKILVAALLSQNFELIEPCEHDSSIHRAIFNQSGGGVFGPYPAFAVVAWKVDHANRIVWTKAMISYTGL